MVFVYILIALIGIIAAFGIVYVVIYNHLQAKKVRAHEAESIIDETLRKRYDAIIRVSNIIKTTIDINAEYFKDFESLKTKKISNFDMDRKIEESITLAARLKHDYPELEENRGIKDVFIELKETDETLEAAKTFYNKYTAELNLIIRKFPSNVVARIHGFEVKPFFDGKNLEDDIVNDFKL